MGETPSQLTLIEALAQQEQADLADLDRVDWLAQGGPYRALDYVFSWRTNQPLLAEALRDCFSPLPPANGQGPGVQHSVALTGNVSGVGFVFADHERVEAVRHAEHALRMVTWHVNREAARVTSERAVVLHAGGVAHGDEVVVLSAPMESGKSTLTTGLVRAGWGYLTDEALAVDVDSLEVTGFPRAITLDKGSWSLFPELRPAGALGHRKLAYAHWHVPADLVRPGCRVPGGRVAAVVLPRYQAGAQTTVRPVSPAEAVAALGQQTFRFAEHPERDLEVLARLVHQAPAYQLRHGSLDEAVAAVAGLPRAVSR